MRYPFESKEAKELNIKIFETLYYGALEASCELAEDKGTYETYEGSPVSKGVSLQYFVCSYLFQSGDRSTVLHKLCYCFQILQYDMWNVKPTDLWDWDKLKAKIAKHGVRNSLLIAPMPTASTAQILGNNESIEPYTSNIYVRRVLSGEFVIINPHLLRDLTTRGLWDNDMQNEILANFGSVQVKTPSIIRVFRFISERNSKEMYTVFFSFLEYRTYSRRSESALQNCLGDTAESDSGNGS